MPELPNPDQMILLRDVTLESAQSGDYLYSPDAEQWYGPFFDSACFGDFFDNDSFVENRVVTIGRPKIPNGFIKLTNPFDILRAGCGLFWSREFKKWRVAKVAVKSLNDGLYAFPTLPMPDTILVTDGVLEYRDMWFDSDNDLCFNPAPEMLGTPITRPVFRLQAPDGYEVVVGDWPGSRNAHCLVWNREKGFFKRPEHDHAWYTITARKIDEPMFTESEVVGSW